MFILADKRSKAESILNKTKTKIIKIIESERDKNKQRENQCRVEESEIEAKSRHF